MNKYLNLRIVFKSNRAMKNIKNRLFIVFFLLLNMLVISCSRNESSKDNKKELQTKEAELTKQLKELLQIRPISKQWPKIQKALEGIKNQATTQELDELIDFFKDKKAKGTKTFAYSKKKYLSKLHDSLQGKFKKLSKMSQDKQDEFYATLIRIFENFKQQKEQK